MIRRKRAFIDQLPLQLLVVMRMMKVMMIVDTISHLHLDNKQSTLYHQGVNSIRRDLAMCNGHCVIKGSLFVCTALHKWIN